MVLMDLRGKAQIGLIYYNSSAKWTVLDYRGLGWKVGPGRVTDAAAVYFPFQATHPRVPLAVAHHPLHIAVGAEDGLGCPVWRHAPHRHLGQLHRAVDRSW